MNVRALFVTDHIHLPQGGGGGERNTHDLCLAMQARGIAVAVACSFKMDNSRLAWSSRFRRALPPRAEYVRDRVCGYPVFRGWHPEGLPGVVRRFRPNVAVVQSTRPGPLLGALSPTGVPAIVYIHEVEDLAPLAGPARDGVPFLANSEFTARRLHERFAITAKVVRPLIDPAAYRVTAHQPTSALFVNTVPRKGLEIVLRLAESRPDIPFDLVTSWILRPEQLAALSARAKAAGNISLHSPTPDMRPHYARTRLLLAPSQWEETWGRVATEAQVNGIPVLASDRGGLPEAVGPGGVLLSADAPHEAWLEGLGQLWDDAAAYGRCAAAGLAHSQRVGVQPDAVVAALSQALTTVAGNRAQELSCATS